MKSPVRILRTMFGYYAAIVFALSLIVVMPLYYLLFLVVPAKRAPMIAHKYLSRNWGMSLLWLYGVRVKTINRHLLDKDTTYVFVANHRSQLDIPAYASATRH